MGKLHRFPNLLPVYKKKKRNEDKKEDPKQEGNGFFAGRRVFIPAVFWRYHNTMIGESAS
jgi:hypothetical protein